jgi:hypothetical protein
MDTTCETPVEYRGYYLAREMIDGRLDHRERNWDNNSRFAIMKASDGKMTSVNWAMTLDVAREKVDHLISAAGRRSSRTRVASRP